MQGVKSKRTLLSMLVILTLTFGLLAPVGFAVPDEAHAAKKGKKITVTFMNGAVKVSTKSVKKGAKIGALPKVSQAGYQFLGWYTAQSGGKKITSSYKITKQQKIYAHWKWAQPTDYSRVLGSLMSRTFDGWLKFTNATLLRDKDYDAQNPGDAYIRYNCRAYAENITNVQHQAPYLEVYIYGKLNQNAGSRAGQWARIRFESDGGGSVGPHGIYTYQFDFLISKDKDAFYSNYMVRVDSFYIPTPYGDYILL